MLYTSTRAGKNATSFQAALEGISPDGGLYIPREMPRLSLGEIAGMLKENYPERAARILSLFFTDFSAKEIAQMCAEAYSSARFDAAAPLKNAGNAHFLELYHGPTQAFKDMALQMLPRLMSGAMKKTSGTGAQNEIVILVATSGDTGKAALEGFRDVPGVRVIVFYPHGGVAEAQRLQMATQEGENVHVCAVKGNFDDAQTGVKKIFADKEFSRELLDRGKTLSSANSINFGRLAPQIVYYFSAYADLVANKTIELGEKVNFCVPTGNFGNILAGQYARRMGLPVGKLICASNSNNVLTDFINTGVYDARRPFIKTISPSMDILVSSNVERLIFELCGRGEAAVSRLMSELSASGRYELPSDAAETLKSSFVADFADEDCTKAEIKRVYSENGYLIDPHTAVASAVYQKYRAETGDMTPTVIISTASPYKFAGDVLSSIQDGEISRLDDLDSADRLEALTGVPMPEPLKKLRTLPERFSKVCEKEDMKETVRGFLFA